MCEIGVYEIWIWEGVVGGWSGNAVVCEGKG